MGTFVNGLPVFSLPPSHQANIGQMDTAKDMWKMIMGNLALIQVGNLLKISIQFV